MNNLKPQKGFTLIEVLISLTILSLIMGVVMGGFRLGSRSWRKGEERLEEQQRMRCVFTILIQDIKSCILLQRSADPEVSGKKRNRANQPVVFIGEADKLKFVTTASGIGPQVKKGTLREVSYGLSYEEDKPGLVMGERPWLYQNPFEDEDVRLGEESSGPPPSIYSLYPDVVDIVFQYYGVKEIHKRPKERDAEPEWHDDWNPLQDIQSGEDYLKNLPEKVKVTLRRKKSEDDPESSTSFEIPIVVGERKT